MISQDKKRKPIAKSPIVTGEPTPTTSGPSPCSAITQAQAEVCLKVAAYMERGVAAADLPDGFAALALRIRGAVAARETPAYFAALVAEAATKFAQVAEEQGANFPQLVSDNARAMKDLADASWEIALDAEDSDPAPVSPKASVDTDEALLRRIAAVLCEIDCETTDGWRRKPVTEAIVSVTHASRAAAVDTPVASLHATRLDVASGAAKVLHRQLENPSVDAAARVEIIDRTLPLFDLCAELLRRSRVALAGQVSR